MAAKTIYDVATHAGVSAATVSRVLNTPNQVNEVTRQRVLTAIDELGFVPKAEAAVRARKVSGRIGVLAPFFSYPSFVQRLRGVALQLADTPYELVIYNVDSDSRRDGYLATLPITHRLDGLVVMALPFQETIAQRLAEDLFPTVLIEVSHPWFSCIEIDDAAGGRLAAEHFIALGHRRFGFLGDDQVPSYAIPTSERRLAGYQQAIEQAGFSLLPPAIIRAPHGLEQAEVYAQRLFVLSEPPTAIFTPSDTQAMGVLKAARERGLAVPGDVAIIGFDDVDIAGYIGLTTIRQPLDESGRVAADLVLSRIATPERPVQHVRLLLSLVRRGTT